MQTFEFTTTALRDTLLFRVHLDEVRDALITTGADVDWTKELHTGPDGQWRMPDFTEYGDRVHEVSSKDPSLNGTLHCNYSTPHGWDAALAGGPWVNPGDEVRAKVTAFDAGRHLIEYWVTRDGEVVGYHGLAHLSEDQDLLGVDFTHERLHELLADPAAVAPTREANPRAELALELHKLELEFGVRRAELYARHGVDPTAPGSSRLGVAVRRRLVTV